MRYVFALGLILLVTTATFGEKQDEFAPQQAELPVSPPEDATVLIDEETNLFLSMAGEEMNWPNEEGVLTSTHGRGNTNHIVSKLHFRDADIHVEFMLPPKGSGNSGVYIHGNYELQIQNSVDKQEIGMDDIGAVYGFAKPLVNAGRPPGQWQVYDIRYRAPRRNEAGEIVEEGTISAWLNGQQVQHGVKFSEPRSVYHPFRHGTTPYLRKIYERQKRTMTGPVFLQDHNNAVRFRNVWVRPLDDQAFLYEEQG